MTVIGDRFTADLTWRRRSMRLGVTQPRSTSRNAMGIHLIVAHAPAATASKIGATGF
jgi:hypothetical protein